MDSLWESVCAPEGAAGSQFLGRYATVASADLSGGSTFGGELEALRHQSVVLATQEQLASALALIELDGVARRVVLCTPDLSPEQLAGIAVTAAADAIVLDAAPAERAPFGLVPHQVTLRPAPVAARRRASVATEWILLTSGTSGMPKLVQHSLGSLTKNLPRGAQTLAERCVWSTFYDIRRYGGLQIFLRAVLGGTPLVLSSAGEDTRDFIARAARAGVTHISGTPSHWRRAIMSGDAAVLDPDYVRLSGEVADQPVLDSLRATFPRARVAHAFASTEAGVAFEVTDGRAGFPAEFLGEGKSNGIDLKVSNNTLHIRSGRTASRYLGAADLPIPAADGYVDTGDTVELIDGRYFFRGRLGGVINVGGLKVHPEEVESVLNADPRVRMSLVRSRRNPITGAVVVADVVLAATADLADRGPADRELLDAVKLDLLNACRRTLPPHKVPAVLRIVESLELTAAGKMVRSGS
jgi:acyl-coenzyme A synthetase/AMP-(fatty) acid ligase